MATVDPRPCDLEWCNSTVHRYECRHGVPHLQAVDSHNFCHCASLEGDSDIAGIGVITAFITAAGLSIICTCLRRCRPQKNPNCRVLDEPPKPYNAVDRFARSWACRYAQRCVRHLKGDPILLGACFYDVVVALGDQQIVAGIAMMAAAIIRTRSDDKPLSTYHLLVISDLVWFSSNAHLLALLIIRSFDDSAKPLALQRKEKARRKISAKFVRAVRAALMALLAGLLLWLSVWLGDETLYDRFQCPAACLATSTDGKGGEPKMWMAVNIFYVCYDYPVALFMLSRHLRKLWVDNVGRRIHKMSKSGIQRVGFSDELGEQPVKALRSVWVGPDTPTGGELSAPSAIRATIWRAQRVRLLLKWAPYGIWTVLSSELFGVTEVAIWFGLGVWWIKGDRDEGHKLMDEAQRKTEDSWGFGQLVPWFLFFLPFMQFFESYAAYSYETACEKELRDRRMARSVAERTMTGPSLHVLALCQK
ncbi:hypothetical protein QBC34DRAFT_340669 [Podospora aff. communis PSN243]|uniref:Uncharacterized protein n=1 Tax=Podospora aff. communis PSN243 TaxID=3040156 RepID=A0AAV9H5N8_9PEZI|nr:hypothetical protein QBC34DRAFT_340669 [Podospora aff. communis PSN243]